MTKTINVALLSEEVLDQETNLPQDPSPKEEPELFKEDELAVVRAKEEVDDLNQEEELAEVKEQANVIDAALEHYATLGAYCEAIKNNQSLSQENMHVAFKRLCSIRAEFGLSNEAYADFEINPQARKVALEGFQDSMTATVKAIKTFFINFFNKLQQWFKTFFKAFQEYQYRTLDTINKYSEAIIENRKKNKDFDNSAEDYISLEIQEKKYLTLNGVQPSDYAPALENVLGLTRPNNTRNIFNALDDAFGVRFFEACRVFLSDESKDFNFHFNPIKATTYEEAGIQNWSKEAMPFGYGAVVNGPFLGDIGFATTVKLTQSTPMDSLEAVIEWKNKMVVMSNAITGNNFRNLTSKEISEGSKVISDLKRFTDEYSAYLTNLQNAVNQQIDDLVKQSSSPDFASKAVRVTLVEKALKNYTSVFNTFVSERVNYVRSVEFAWLNYLKAIAVKENVMGK